MNRVEKASTELCNWFRQNFKIHYCEFWYEETVVTADKHVEIILQPVLLGMWDVAKLKRRCYCFVKCKSFKHV